MPRLSTFVVTLTAIALFGAGCSTDSSNPHVAQPLVSGKVQTVVSQTKGFGALPPMPTGTGRANVTLAQPIPALPLNVTVLRPRSGTTNDTEFRNLLNALGISDGFIGNTPNIKELSFQWDDDVGNHWSYHGSDRALDFSSNPTSNEQMTVVTPPSNDAAIQTASAFLVARGIPLQSYGQPIVAPDWTTWWNTAKASGRCVDASALSSIRAIASSATYLISSLPVLPDAQSTQCISPEFPAKVIVRFHAVADGRLIVKADGSNVNGVELVVDTVRNTVVAGRIVLTTDPERSDYPTITAGEVMDRVSHGGALGVNGDITINAYDFASLRLPDVTKNAIYLVPSLVANGIKKNADGTVTNVTLVVPLASP